MIKIITSHLHWQKMKLSIKHSFSKCDQIRRKLTVFKTNYFLLDKIRISQIIFTNNRSSFTFINSLEEHENSKEEYNLELRWTFSADQFHLFFFFFWIEVSKTCWKSYYRICEFFSKISNRTAKFVRNFVIETSP